MYSNFEFFRGLSSVETRYANYREYFSTDFNSLTLLFTIQDYLTFYCSGMTTNEKNYTFQLLTFKRRRGKKSTGIPVWGAGCSSNLSNFSKSLVKNL